MDALHNEVDRQGLQEVLQKYKDSFAKDSLDCGLTSINGKWRPTIDYRKLNQQVPFSRWSMTQFDQEIPKIKGSSILSTLDIATGFWTIPVHPDDQHKLAFTVGNRQYCKKARLERSNDGSRSAGEGLCVLQSFLFTTQQEH